jgi:hypothetical protein
MGIPSCFRAVYLVMCSRNISIDTFSSLLYIQSSYYDTRADPSMRAIEGNLVNYKMISM